MVQGAVDRLHDGFFTAKAIEEASSEYFAEQDVMAHLGTIDWPKMVLKRARLTAAPNVIM